MTRLDISSVAHASLPAVPCTWKHRETDAHTYEEKKNICEAFFQHHNAAPLCHFRQQAGLLQSKEAVSAAALESSVIFLHL